MKLLEDIFNVEAGQPIFTKKDLIGIILMIVIYWVLNVLVGLVEAI